MEERGRNTRTQLCATKHTKMQTRSGASLLLGSFFQENITTRGGRSMQGGTHKPSANAIFKKDKNNNRLILIPFRSHVDPSL